MRNRLTAFLRLAPLFLMAGMATAQESTPAPPPPLDPAKVRVVMENAVDDFIRPGYRDFHASAGQLQASVSTLCETPSADHLAAARAAFADTVTHWGTIEIVRLGPAIEKNRFERVLYYPDRKGLGLRQVQRLLAESDESVTTREGLAQKSVAVQGLGALEFVLYGDGEDTLLAQKNGFRCRYGAAVAASITATASELADAWESSAVRTAWVRPGADNPLYRDEREAITALLGILVHGAEAIRDQRIESFYKGADKVRFPKMAIFWRSENTWKSVGANLEGVQRLLRVSGMQDLLPDDQRSVIGSLDFILKSMIRTTGKIDTDIAKALDNDEDRGRVDYLLLNGKDLIYRLNDQYGAAIGLGAGFSFSDGD